MFHFSKDITPLFPCFHCFWLKSQLIFIPSKIICIFNPLATFKISLNIFPISAYTDEVHSSIGKSQGKTNKQTILTSFPMIYLWMVFLYLFCLWFIHLNLWPDVFISFENFSIISSNIEYKTIAWSWNTNTSATWCEELTRVKRPRCWEGLRVGREGTAGGALSSSLCPPPSPFLF